jgi:hypothetical protein
MEFRAPPCLPKLQAQCFDFASSLGVIIMETDKTMLGDNFPKLFCIDTFWPHSIKYMVL